MTNYSTKRQKIKKGQLAQLDYMPNKLVYISDINDKEIVFYAFFKEKGDEAISPKRHTMSLNSIRSFNTIPECFSPVNQIVEMIKELSANNHTL